MRCGADFLPVHRPQLSCAYRPPADQLRLEMLVVIATLVQREVRYVIQMRSLVRMQASEYRVQPPVVWRDGSSHNYVERC
jgi:hypothetical protein